MILTYSRPMTWLILMLLVTPFTSMTDANADMIFKYKSSSVSVISENNAEMVSPECDDPSNVGTVGSAPGCDGMLIVDDNSLRSAASKEADPEGGYDPDQQGGSGNFYIDHNGISYTFGDDENNIFTGQVKDMSSLLRNTDFNGDIGYWDVSSVTTMRYMFFNNHVFNQHIGDWDVANVENMKGLFYRAIHFNQDIGSWDVSNVTNMSYMFKTANYFNQDIGSWDTSSVKDMNRMFRRPRVFNQDISDWDVSNVTNMNLMFRGAESFNQDLSEWCVSQISSYPAQFARNTPSWSKEKPSWGDCPE